MTMVQLAPLRAQQQKTYADSNNKRLLSQQTKVSSKYFTLDQRVRNIQDSMSPKYYNALDHGEIVEHVSNFICSHPNLENISSSEFRDVVIAGVDDFLNQNQGYNVYSHLDENTQESNLSKTIYSPVNFMTEHQPTRPTVSAVSQKVTTHSIPQWRATSTSGHNNNCGIFAMSPRTSPQQAQTVRHDFLKFIQEKHNKGLLTDVDYSHMQMNLPSPKSGMSYNQIFKEYVRAIKSGSFLDPFALQKIASMNGKHLLILDQNSPSDRGKSLREIYLNNRILVPFEEVIFITHNGSNHFESVVSQRI